MLTLAFDTSSPRLSLGLYEGSRPLGEHQADTQGQHAEALLPAIDRLTREAGKTPKQLQLVAVGLGPGSFTGTRIGIAAAKGLALALNIPVLGINALEALAHAAPEPIPRIALINAGRGQLFAAAYATDPTAPPLAAPAVVNPEALLQTLARLLPGAAALLGDGLELAQHQLPSAWRQSSGNPVHPRASEIARLALGRMHQTGPTPLDTLAPLYLRPPDITAPKPRITAVP